MKRMKTIIAILVVSCTMIACQTNEDVLDLETSNSTKSEFLRAKEPVSQRTPLEEDSIPFLGTSLLVVYDHLLDPRFKLILRQAFIDAGLVIILLDPCEEDHKETWLVNLMSYEEVQAIYTQVVNPEPWNPSGKTVVVKEEDGSGPKPGAGFRIFYDGDCDSEI